MVCAQKWQPGRKSEPRESCFRWERLKCAWAARSRTRSQWKGKQKESQSKREHQVTERGGWWGQFWDRKGLLEGKEEMCSSAKVSLEQRAPVESQNGGRMNKEISSITRYPTAGEHRRGNGGWKVARAGGMAWGTCTEPATEKLFCPFSAMALAYGHLQPRTMSFS